MGIDNQGHVTSVGHCAVGVDAERIARDVYVYMPSLITPFSLHFFVNL